MTFGFTGASQAHFCISLTRSWMLLRFGASNFDCWSVLFGGAAVVLGLTPTQRQILRVAVCGEPLLEELKDDATDC